MPMSHKNRDRRAKMRYRILMNRDRGATTAELRALTDCSPAACYRQLKDMEVCEQGLTSRMEYRDGRRVRVWYDPEYMGAQPAEAVVVAHLGEGRLPGERFIGYEPAIEYVRRHVRAGTNERIESFEIFEAADGFPWPGQLVLTVWRDPANGRWLDRGRNA